MNYNRTTARWRRIRKNYASGDHLRKARDAAMIYAGLLEEKKTLHELGCGNGRNLDALARKCPWLTLTGNDVSWDRITQGCKMFPDTFAKAETSTRDTLTYLKRMAPVDVIMTSGHFMHLPPGGEWDQVVALVSEKCRMLLMMEAWATDYSGLSQEEEVWYRQYRFDRDYRDYFFMCEAEERLFRVITDEKKPRFKWARYALCKK